MGERGIASSSEVESSMTVPLLRMEVKAFGLDDPACPNTAPIDDGDTGPAKTVTRGPLRSNGDSNHTLSRIVTNSSRAIDGIEARISRSAARHRRFCGLSERLELSATG